MNSSRSLDLRTVSADHARRLHVTCERLMTSGVSHSPLRRLASRVGRILRTKAVFLTEVDGVWVSPAESRGEPQLSMTPAVVSALAERTAPDVRLLAEGARHWTLLNVRQGLAGPPLTLALAGDWTNSATELRGLGAALAPILRRMTGVATLGPVAAATHRLTRTLGRVTGVREVCSTVLRYVVRAVPSRVATFAVPLDENELAVVATHGYPVELVEHVRITPGQGVIGRVYQSRSPVYVPDVLLYPGLERRRPRYRTNSFIAFPVTAGSHVLGVVCVTDRIGGPFTRDDLLVLRELTAPAALALARERVQRQAEALAHAAVIDPVSGLFNRRYLQKRLEEETQRAQRTKTPVGLVMLDIDDFKSINDQFGHPAGDTVIRAVSDILRRSVRRFDLCTRFGGEEFAIVMPGSALENSTIVAERIRQRIAGYKSDVAELKALRVTASIGLCVSYGMTAQEMLEVADRALYAAKRGGKNRVVGPSVETGSP